MQYKRIAESLMHRFKTRDPFRIAADLGYIVIRIPMNGIRGFFHCIKRQKIIYIDSNLPNREARFVCAHEIGHAQMHRGYNRVFMDANTYFPVNRQEIEANCFAVELLYDDSELAFLLEYPVQLAADYMGVSIELAEYRLGSINSKQYHNQE